jgi:hypothetical protein
VRQLSDVLLCPDEQGLDCCAEVLFSFIPFSDDFSISNDDISVNTYLSGLGMRINGVCIDKERLRRYAPRPGAARRIPCLMQLIRSKYEIFDKLDNDPSVCLNKALSVDRECRKIRSGRVCR